MGLRTQSRLWYGAIGLLAAAQLLASVFLPRGFALTATTDVVASALIGVTALACLVNAVAARGRLRLFWSLQTIAYGALLSSQTLWAIFEVVLRREAPNPFVGDVFLFLAEVPAVAGLLLQPHAEPSRHESKLGVVDFLLLLLWWLYLYLFFVIPWQYVILDEARYGTSYNALDIVQSIVTLVVVGWLWQRAQGAWKIFYALYFGAQIVSTASDYLANHAIDTHAYFPGSWYELPYTISLAFFAALVVLGAGLASAPLSIRKPRSGVGVSAVVIPAVLSLPVMTAWALLGHQVPSSVTQFRVLVSLGTMFAMALLAFIKQRELSKELHRMNSVLQEASITDPLTGARNRRFFHETIPADVDHVLRSYSDHHDPHTRDLVFYLIDADNFKDVNDRFGHGIGDKVLVEMARRIATAIRNSDVLVRWGGEEFLVLSRYTDRAEAGILASRVLFAVGNEPFIVEGIDEPLCQKCSIGWAAFPFLPQSPNSVSYDEVLSLADRGLYVAKHQGKNRAIGVAPGKSDIPTVPEPTPARAQERLQLPIEILSTPGPNLR